MLTLLTPFGSITSWSFAELSFESIMSSTSLPLPQLFSKTLQSLLPVFDDTITSSDPSAQSSLTTALDNLHLISRMLTSLGVFSTNESVDELGDGEMVFMTIGWVVAECEGKGGLGGTADRMEALKRSEVSMYFKFWANAQAG